MYSADMDPGSRMYTPGNVRTGAPMIVYTVDSPEYPDRMFGLSPYKREYKPFRGSVIYVGAGVFSPGLESESREPEISETHLIHELGAVGQYFAERATQAFVTPNARVILQRSGELAAPTWVSEARRAGFDCIAYTSDVACMGTGAMLSAVHWLQGAYDWDDAHLIASRQPLSALEDALLAGAASGANLRHLIGSFFYRAYTDPDSVQRELDGYDVLAGLVGIQGEYLGIYRADTNVDHVAEVFGRIASDLGVPLYYGGSAIESSATVDLFGPLPGDSRAWRDWQRIA